MILTRDKALSIHLMSAVKTTPNPIWRRLVSNYNKWRGLSETTTEVIRDLGET